MADEPRGNRDGQTGDEILAILRGLTQCDVTTTVMVTHDPRLANQTSRIFRLPDARIRVAGALCAPGR